MRWPVVVLAMMFGGAQMALAQQKHQNVVIDLWALGKPAFGVYAPNEQPGPRGQRGQPPQPAVYTRGGGEKLAMNPLYDFVFLNLEGELRRGGGQGDGGRAAQPEGRRPQDADRAHPAD